MRCPHCQAENSEGAANCENCETPLTAYGGQITGTVSDATLAKLARLRKRPLAVPLMVAFSALVSVFGPLRSAVTVFITRPTANAESTNYIGSAVGAVGVFLNAIVMVPLGLALLLAAWGAYAQRAWAWWANLVVLAIVAGIAVFGPAGGTFTRVVLLAASTVLAVFWFQRSTREWYGV